MVGFEEHPGELGGRARRRLAVGVLEQQEPGPTVRRDVQDVERLRVELLPDRLERRQALIDEDDPEPAERALSLAVVTFVVLEGVEDERTLVFDVEVVFMYPWAVTFHEFLDAGIGLGVLGVMVFFIFVLTVGLVYDIKKGGLEF